MTQLIPTNLPLYFQCLRVPTEWREVRPGPLPKLNALLRRHLGGSDSCLLEARVLPGLATSFDPWEMRGEFFRLKQGDSEGLLRFLSTVGLFEGFDLLSAYTAEQSPEIREWMARTKADEFPYSVRYVAETTAKRIWGLRRLLENSLIKQSEIGEVSDFSVRIVRMKGRPQVIITTTTFLDALLLTLTVDRVLDARVRKCARPDCGVTFTVTTGHKQKYHDWYCGHIESVRKQRRKARKARKAVGNGKQL